MRKEFEAHIQQDLQDLALDPLEESVPSRRNEGRKDQGEHRGRIESENRETGTSNH